MPATTVSTVVSQCINSEKKILAEKPIPDFFEIMRLAKEKDGLLMLNFHRRHYLLVIMMLTCYRFDKKFQKARDYLVRLVNDGGDLKSLVVTTEDRAPPSSDTIEIIRTSCINEIDLISWMLEDVDCEITLKYVKPVEPLGITILFSLWLRKYDKTVEARIQYSRGHASLLQKVIINGQAFGYDIPAERIPSVNTFSLYVDAFVRQFRFFSELPVKQHGQGNFCQTYLRTYTLLSACSEAVVDDATDTDASDPTDPIAALSKDFSGVKPSAVVTRGGLVYKPLLHKENEWRVYTLIREKMPDLVKWIQVLREKVVINSNPYLVLEDCTAPYRFPRVFSLKIGEPSDFVRMPNQPYGLKVVSYTTAKGEEKDLRSHHYSWNDIYSYLKEFIKDKDTGNSRYEIIPDWLLQLKELRKVMEPQCSLIFRATLVKLVYDGVEDSPHKPLVRLCDISRAKDSNDEFDHCFCFGLENLVRLLEEIHTKFVNRHAVFLCRHGFGVDHDDLQWAPTAKYPKDPPLSEEGIRQAHNLAERLRNENISVVVTSPFARARQTAKVKKPYPDSLIFFQIIAKELGIKYVVEPAMAGSPSLSDPQRKPQDSLDPAQEDDAALLDNSFTPLSSNSAEWWQENVRRALAAVCQQHKRVAVVAHASTFQALLDQIPVTGTWDSNTQRSLEFASVTTLLPSNGPAEWAIERLNKPSHVAHT